MALILLQGPAGAGKSQLAAAMLEAGEVRVLADVTSLWAALSGAVRGPDGRYPVRANDDPALIAARYIQRIAVRRALETGADVAVTTSQRGQEEYWRRWAEDAGTGFRVRTVDPGLDAVTARLAEDSGELSRACQDAIGRWYGEL